MPDSDAQDVFELSNSVRLYFALATVGVCLIFPWVFYGWLQRRDVFSGLFLVVWFSIAAPMLGWIWLVMPWRIAVTEASLVFIPRTGGPTSVPWSELREVRPAQWYDMNRMWVTWRWATGRLTTPSRFKDFHGLLNAASAHAPQLVTTRL